MSTIPAALDALEQIGATAMPAGVTVVAGPHGKTVPVESLNVGYGGDEGSSAVIAQQTPGDYDRGSDRESYDVFNELAVHNGNSSMSAARVRVFALKDLFAAALEADYTLGGAVMQAAVTDFEYLTATTSRGPAAVLRFTVHVDAFK